MFSQYIDNFADELGPQQIIHIYDPKTQLRAIVAIDNLALGPAYRRLPVWRRTSAPARCSGWRAP